jgi:hypothetical protein
MAEVIRVVPMELDERDVDARPWREGTLEESDAYL